MAITRELTTALYQYCADIISGTPSAFMKIAKVLTERGASGRPSVRPVDIQRKRFESSFRPTSSASSIFSAAAFIRARILCACSCLLPGMSDAVAYRLLVGRQQGGALGLHGAEKKFDTIVQVPTED